MTGADLVKTAAQDQPLSVFDVSGKSTAADLIEESFAVDWTGTQGKAQGTVKNVEWPEFSAVEAEQSGHYVPLMLDSRYEGQEITMVGAKTTTARSLNWVIRLDDLMKDSKKLTAKAEGEEIFTIDFTDAEMAE